MVIGLSPAICVENAAHMRDFYVDHFAARVVFDCGWYINVEVDGQSMCFMEPQSESMELFNGKGLTYNFEVADVDAEYERLSGVGLVIVMPLEDHPWGDRGFATVDPAGVVLYIYRSIEPSEEYLKFYTASPHR